MTFFYEQTKQMCASLESMLSISFKALHQEKAELMKEAEEHARFVHKKEKELLEFLLKNSSQNPRSLISVPTHIERIGDGIEEIMRCFLIKIEEGIPFSERALKELNTLYEGALLLIQCTKDTILTKNKVLQDYVIKEGERFSGLANEYATFHEERLIEGLCLSKASSIYLAILDAFKQIYWHCAQIVRKCI